MGLLRKLTWIETKLFIREPLSMSFVFVYPVIVIVVLFGFFADLSVEEGPLAGVSMVDNYVPAYAGLVIASLGLLGLPVHLAGYRELGVLRRFRVSGMPAWAVFGSQALATLSLAVVGVATIILIGVAAYGAHWPRSPAGFLIAFLLSVFSLAAIGALIGAALPTARATLGTGLILWFMSMMLSGTDGPLPAMPPWLQRAAEALPLTHAVKALQYPWAGLGWNWREDLILLLIGGAASLAAVWLLRRD